MVKKTIISEILYTTEAPANAVTNLPIEHVPEGFTNGTIFQINSTKLNIPVVTLSFNNNKKFLEYWKQGLKRTVSWNRYSSEITTQPNNNNLDYMIDPNI